MTTLSRRDIIRYATASSFLAALPASERAAAMQALERPISDNPTLDPALFAENTHSMIATYEDVWYSSIAPEEWAAWRQTKDRLNDLVPQLKDSAGHRAIWDADCEVDNALLSLICASHRAGLRQGARFEHLRQSLVAETAECRTCWGHGVDNGQACPTCAGSGVVPFAEGRQQR